MAIVVRGQTICPLCSMVIDEDQNIVAFTYFVPNEIDPLLIFNDAAFHEDCFKRHPLAEKAIARSEELQHRNSPKQRFCVVCKRPIDHWYEYFSLGHLTDDQSDSLFQHNYAQFHRSCLREWPELAHVYDQLKAMNETGMWRGRVLEWFLSELRTALRT